MWASSHPETLVGTAQFSMQKRGILCKFQEDKDFRGGALEYAAQGNSQSDDEITPKRRFWTRTG